MGSGGSLKGLLTAALVALPAVASAQAPATMSFVCPRSVAINATYQTELVIDVGAGSPCVPPGQSAMMCGLGAYNVELAYDLRLPNGSTVPGELVPASAEFPIQGGLASGFMSTPPPPPPPDCGPNCQEPVTNPTTFTSGLTKVAAFNTLSSFASPTGQASVLKATVKGVALGTSRVSVTTGTAQVVDTNGTPFAVTPPATCQTAVSQYACLGDKSNNNCVTSAEAQLCIANGNKPNDPALNPQCDGDANGAVSPAEVQRGISNANKCVGAGCIP